MNAVLISGSPSPRSRSRVLLAYARDQLDASGYSTSVIDLAGLPADALLGRRPDEGVAAALDAVQRAGIVVASSPVYRATYSGLLKVFFDLLPIDSLRHAVAVPLMTGGSASHLLAVDVGMRPLFASLGATVVPTGVYGYDAQFSVHADAALLGRVERAIDEAVALARATQPATAQTA